MAIPNTALVWDDTMDPYDLVDYDVDCTPMLQSGEGISSYTLVPNSESALLGLQVGSTGQYAPTMSGNVITLWLSVDSSKQQDPAFDGLGTKLPITLSITTSSLPPRKRQRTLVVQVVQR